MKKLFAVLLSVSFLALVASPGVAQPPEKQDAIRSETGADPRTYAEIEKSWAKDEKAQHKEWQDKKEKQVSDYLTAKAMSTMSVQPGSLLLSTPLITQDIPVTYDKWNQLDTTPTRSLWSQAIQQVNGTTDTQGNLVLSSVPRDDNARYCAHCGTAGALIILKWLAWHARAEISDLGTNDQEAIFRLGAGYNNGFAQRSHYMMTCCDSTAGWSSGDLYHSRYYTDAGRATTVMNGRLRNTTFRYALGGVSTEEGLHNRIRADIDSGYPLLISVNMTYLPYMERPHQSGFGHFIVIDGYEWDITGTITGVSVNDMNNCSAYANPGHHWITTAELWGAITAPGASRVAIW